MTVLVVGVGCWVGSLLAFLALMAPHLLGVATMPVDGAAALAWFPLDTFGGLVANAAGLATLIWGATWGIRGVLRVAGLAVPASTWTALTFGPAALLALTPLASMVGAGVLAALALRYTAYEADGGVRPEPLDALPSTARHALRVAIPVVAIGTATAYCVYHPLTLSGSLGEVLKPARTTIDVRAMRLTNDGGRSLRILAIEPGIERGYALHLSGVALDREDVIMPGEAWTRPFHPFTLRPHQESPGLSLRLSRAGCRPGAAGRIESVRVRYLLGGERTMLLKLDEPIVLSC